MKHPRGAAGGADGAKPKKPKLDAGKPAAQGERQRTTYPISSVPTCGFEPSKPRPGQPCFAITGMELSRKEKHIIINKLGGVVANSWAPEITHVIADTFRRTTKLLCAICTGAHIVFPSYVMACYTAGKLVDAAPFTVQEEICETAFARKRGISEGFSLVEAVERARRQGPLLKGFSVYCFPSVVEIRELPLLVAAAGGTWLEQFPASPGDATVLLLAERPVSGDLEAQCRRDHRVYDVEMLREAACTQELRRKIYRLR